MAATSAQIVDFQAYRDARRQADAPAVPTQPAFSGYHPMVMWVPVWTFFPMAMGPWVHAQ